MKPAIHGLAGMSPKNEEMNMILVVDIGNTTVSFGGVEISYPNAYRVRFRTKLDTNSTWDAADYTVHLLKRWAGSWRISPAWSFPAWCPGCWR